MVGAAEEELRAELQKLKGDLERTQEELKSARTTERRGEGRRPLKDVTCYGCGEKGHYKRECPKAGREDQGNGPRRLGQQ